MPGLRPSAATIHSAAVARITVDLIAVAAIALGIGVLSTVLGA